MLLRLNAVTRRKEKPPSAVKLRVWYLRNFGFQIPAANNNNLLGTNNINRAINDVELMTQMISASVIMENVNSTPFSSLLK